MSNADTIEQGIADLLAGVTGLDALARIFLGMPYNVPTQHWPYALVVIDAEESGEQMTGGRVVRAYSGAVVFNLYHQDLPESVAGGDARIVRVPSYATLRGWMDAAIGALKADTALAGLALASGHVRHVIVGQDAVQYGLTADAERPDNILQFGVLPFTVETVEVF